MFEQARKTSFVAAAPRAEPRSLERAWFGVGFEQLGTVEREDDRAERLKSRVVLRVLETRDLQPRA